MVLHSASNTALKAARGQAVLELELDPKLHARAAIADGSKRHSPIRSRNGPWISCMWICASLCRVLRVVNSMRSTPRATLTAAMRSLSDNILDAGADAPGQEFRVAGRHH